MRCPKCGHIQKGEQECDSCGIIFEKYNQNLSRLRELEVSRNQRRSSLPAFLAVAAVVGLGGSFVLLSSDDEMVAAVAPGPAKAELQANLYEEYMQKPLLDRNIKEDLAAATFGVTESRYTATAFLVTRGCLALTNKVIKKSPRRSGGYDNSYKIDSLRGQISDLEEQLEEMREKFISSCNDCSQGAFQKRAGSLQRKLESKQRELDKNQAIAERNAPKEEGGIALSLDRMQHRGRLLSNSDTLQLSLITSGGKGCDPVSTVDSIAVKAGDEVYLMGWNNRVTKGSITGFSPAAAGHSYMMHDAKPGYINGFAGAPAFNKEGEVIGISIPKTGKQHYLVRIEDALQEFNVVY